MYDILRKEYAIVLHNKAFYRLMM